MTKKTLHVSARRQLAGRAALALGTVLFATGCTVPVAGGIEEGDANRIVVALDRVRVDATKEPDPATEGRFRVVVPRDDVARALSAMSAEGLPRPNPAGVLSSVDRGALVPSRTAEHAQVVAGLAGDLERTLESVDGVLAARVHLNLPEPEPLRDVPGAKATASVLLEHRGSRPPIAPPEIQRLLAGGVAGLAPQDIAVVMIERAGGAATATATQMGDAVALAHVGPIAVARSSARALQAALGVLLALVAVLAGMTLSLYARLSRARSGGGSGGGDEGAGGGAGGGRGGSAA